MDFQTFESRDMVIDAVVRNFEIIGEASAQLDAEFKDLNAEIPWAKMKGLRNRIVHAILRSRLRDCLGCYQARFTRFNEPLEKPLIL